MKVLRLSVSAIALGSFLASNVAIAQTYGSSDANEIIVTARKKEESLAVVPLQISVFDADTIESRDFRDLNDIAQSTPGLEYENYVTAGLSSAPVIRGMSQTFTTSRIQNTAAFLDGIYLQRQSMVNPGLMDTERVEVVKGPQSAVYGRNAFSGAINYVTKKPENEAVGSVSGTVGTGGRADFKLSLSGALIEDVLLARMSFGKSDFDGHTDNMHPFANAGPTKNGTNDLLGGWDDQLFSGGVVFKPKDNIEISANYYQNESSREPQGMYYLTGPRQIANDASWNVASNQTNCVNTTTFRQIRFFVPGLGLQVQNVPVFGSSAFCGQLPTRPPSDPVLAAGGVGDGEITVDPRSHAVTLKSEIWQAGIDWDVNDRFNLNYQFGYIEHEADGNGVAQGRDSIIGSVFEVAGPPPPPPIPAPSPLQFNFTTFNANPQEALQSSSHEIRFGYDGDKFDAGVGLYLSNVEDEDSGTFYFSPACNSAAACGETVTAGGAGVPPELVINRGPFAPPLIIPLFPFSTHGNVGNHVQYEDDVTAVFADVNWDMSDEWTLIAEARYEKETKTFNQNTTTFGLPAPIFAEEEFEFFTPRVTARWTPEWAGGNMMYALAAKGVKIGGFNAIDPTANPDQFSYDAETNWTYEIGGRGTYLDGRFFINGAAYYIDWKSIQGTEAANSTDPFAVDVTGNIGDARVWGVEFDGLLKFSEKFGLDYTFAWLDPKYKNAVYESSKTVNPNGTPDLASSWGCSDLTPECNANGDVSGNTLERTSTQQASLGLNYNSPISIGNGWNLNARWAFNWRNKMYATPLNLAHNGDRMISNANIGISNDNITLSLWGKNIFNKKYVANSFVLPSFNQYIVGLGAEQTFGMTAKYDF